jgi:hypothetical protein
VTLSVFSKYGRALLKHYGLNGWQIKAVTMDPEYLGLCDVNACVIEINKLFVAKGKTRDIDDALRHEIAHALAGNTEETRRNPHGKAWKKKCKLVGAKIRLAIPFSP